MDWLNYHHLLYFWVVAKQGSIVKACKKLHLSQPTISNQLKTLEQAIGQDLFQRSGRQMILTEMGQMVFRYADDIFSIGQDLQQFLQGQTPASRRQRLTIGITDSLPKMVSYRILEPLLAMQDSVRFVCMEDDNLEGLLVRLSLYELDVVLADAPVSPGTKIKAYNHLLGECGVSFFVAPARASAYRKKFPQSLKDAPMLMPSDNTALRPELEEWLTTNSIKPHIVGEFDDTALLKVFGQMGHGVFALPSVIEDDIIQSLGVECIGRAENVRNRFYAISIQRKLGQPVITQLVEKARKGLFKSSEATKSGR
ncbi:MAG: transcriptional activator NhaR [Candidatus Sericytochromatia bacterium]|nr:transcriptional activator NhaR [Candidatus Sericytochromatia bacterium]